MLPKEISSQAKRPILFICTGLGRVQRGFESYIHDLALHVTIDTPYSITVYGGGKIAKPAYRFIRVPNLSRNADVFKWLKLSVQKTFFIEQISFFLGFLPALILKKPKAIYLGEYTLYCYLFKLRKWLGLSYHLILYTGGQAVPGLFDSEKDYIHHVTDVYYKGLLENGIPENRQFVLPHFIDTHFSIDQSLYTQVKTKCGNKRIILSVGLLDKTVKRMHLIPELLGQHCKEVFLIILGESSADTEEIENLYRERFGTEGYIMQKVPRHQLGTYYALADFFMLCSKRESFGLVYAEALYHGIPVISHDFYEARYVCGEQAYYINMDQPETAAEALDMILHKEENDKEKKRRRAEYVSERFTWDKLRKDYLAMFERIIYQ